MCPGQIRACGRPSHTIGTGVKSTGVAVRFRGARRTVQGRGCSFNRVERKSTCGMKTQKSVAELWPGCQHASVAGTCGPQVGGLSLRLAANSAPRPPRTYPASQALLGRRCSPRTPLGRLRCGGVEHKQRNSIAALASQPQRRRFCCQTKHHEGVCQCVRDTKGKTPGYSVYARGFSGPSPEFLPVVRHRIQLGQDGRQQLQRGSVLLRLDCREAVSEAEVPQRSLAEVAQEEAGESLVGGGICVRAAEGKVSAACESRQPQVSVCRWQAARGEERVTRRRPGWARDLQALGASDAPTPLNALRRLGPTLMRGCR